MKILVAGGAGYIGSVLVPALLEHGYEVDVIDLLWFGAYLPEEVKIIKKNLFDCGVEEFEQYDQIIFLAGLSNDPMAEYDPARNFIYNAALPAYIAFIARRAGVKRFIYASTCSVYGYTMNELCQEDDPVTCIYPYGISKLQGEGGILQLQHDTFSVIALRKGTTCGHSPRMRMDLIVNTMFKSAMNEKRIVVNDPFIWRPVLDIRDASNAYLRAIQADQSICGVYNISSDNYTVGQVADLVKTQLEALTRDKIEIEVQNKRESRSYKVSIERAKTVLGYNPRYGIEDVVNDLYEHRMLYGNYDRNGFYNIQIFREIHNHGSSKSCLPAYENVT